MKDKVSVIVPCYKCENYITECVDSVLASSYKNVEIIVVNDGSPDNVLNVLEKYKKSSIIKIINQDNQGLSAARNNGIKKATGKYILPLDSDDKIAPDYIEKAIAEFERNPNLGIVYCQAEFFGEKSVPWELETYNFPRILSRNCIFCSAVFKKSDWEKAGGYKAEMIYGIEDYEFWISLIEKGAQVYQIPEVLFYYRKKISDSMCDTLGSSIEKQKQMLKQIICFHLNLYKKHEKALTSDIRTLLCEILGKPAVLETKKYLLFKFLPIFSQAKFAHKKTYSILGIPFWKIKSKKNCSSVKYYLFNIPLLKVTKK